jgi:hypothetical protein
MAKVIQDQVRGEEVQQWRGGGVWDLHAELFDFFLLHDAIHYDGQEVY